ncbi:flagellar hook-length control protein FliK [Salipiger manganoxidans]|nr:flagellar hook-length control protein FliK [Salipiger manganoxidans]
MELRLEPEELGHVRFRMTGGEHALSMTILADRPETLDLLRRHVDQLARHLDDLGYSATQFRFGEGSGQGGAFRGSFAGGDGPEDLDTIPQNDTSEPSSGLDIRV